MANVWIVHFGNEELIDCELAIGVMVVIIPWEQAYFNTDGRNSVLMVVT